MYLQVILTIVPNIACAGMALLHTHSARIAPDPSTKVFAALRVYALSGKKLLPVMVVVLLIVPHNRFST